MKAERGFLFFFLRTGEIILCLYAYGNCPVERENG